MRNKIVTFLVFFFVSSFYANSECPIEDFGEVIPFCTEDNEYGITYPAGTTDKGIPFFEGDYIYDGWNYWGYLETEHNSGCLGSVPAPAWFAMQIESEGSLFIEISHSEIQDVDFACFGPYEGDSKLDMLRAVCADPESSFFTSISYGDYLDYNSSNLPSEDCNYSEEFASIEDTIIKYSELYDSVYSEMRDNCYEYYDEYGNFISEDFNCEFYYQEELDKYARLQNMYEGLDPRFYDITSNCFRAKLDPFPNGKMVDCSYSANAKEICQIDNAHKGEWYILLITNYSRQPGDITFKKVAGEATTNCSIIVDAFVSNVCEGGDIEFMVNNAPDDATFKWSGPNGFSSTLQAPVIHNASSVHEGTYSVIMQSNGITSPTVDLDVVVYKPCELDTTITIAWGESYKFGDMEYSASGNYTHTFTTVNGCDSVVNLKLVVSELNVTTHSNLPLCEGQTLKLTAEGEGVPSNVSFFWKDPNGLELDGLNVTVPDLTTQKSGLYTLMMLKNGKYYELATEDVSVGSFFEVNVDTIFRFGDTILLGDKKIYEPGVFKETFPGQSGCDSVVSITVKPYERFLKNSGPVCEGGSYVIDIDDYYPESMVQWFGPNGLIQEGGYSLRIDNVKSSDKGTYTVKFTDNGVVYDSYDTEIVMYEKIEIDTTITIMEGDYYEFGSSKLSEPGEYSFTMESSTGCDSVVNINLQVKELEVNIVTDNNGPLCEGESLVLSARNIPNRVKIQWTGPNGFRSEDSLVTISNVSVADSGTYCLEASYNMNKVLATSTHVEVYSIDKIELFEQLIDSVFTFNDLVLNKPGEYTVTLKNANGCDSIITLHLQWAWDSILVVPDPYFSPNGDGVRDLWFIEGVDRFPTSVKIFDRFGKTIRMYDAYRNEDGWDGKDSKGDDMPSSDYWYVILNRTIDKIFVGHVSLIR